MSEQQEQLSRVKARISPVVEEFITERWTDDHREFTIRQLHDYIYTRTHTAPASPDRILRQLRLEGKFDYEVIDRWASKYRITALGSSQRQRKAKTVTLPAPVIDHLFSSNNFEPTAK